MTTKKYQMYKTSLSKLELPSTDASVVQGTQENRLNIVVLQCIWKCSPQRLPFA